MNKAIRAYLAGIGRQGGKISRRTLTPEQRRMMGKAKAAKKKGTKNEKQ